MNGLSPDRDGRKYAFIYQHPYSLRLEHEKARACSQFRLARPPLAISRRNRERNKMKALAIGGAADHVHMLISLPATLSLSKALQLLKGNSSKWIHETFPKLHPFEWQEGYGAFSIGVSGVDATAAYIRNQTEHHRTRSFREEFRAMLRRHGFHYDERMLD
jgi:putative transposase